MAAGFNIVIAALVLSIIALGISFVVYVWARPRLTLEVAHAEVVSVRVPEELRGGPLTVR